MKTAAARGIPSLLVAFVVAACGTGAASGPDIEPTPLEQASGTPVADTPWATYEDLGAGFTISVYPVSVGEIEDDGAELQYRIDITATSEFRDFTATLVLDSELDDYLIGGPTGPAFGDFDLFPSDSPELMTIEGAARGLEATDARTIVEAESLDELGLDPSRIEPLAGAVSLWLRWDGGEELYSYVVPVLDPDGLLDS